MNKKKLSNVTLFFFFFTLWGCWSAFSRYAEPTILAYSLFLLPLFLGIATLLLRSAAKKEQAAAAAAAKRERDQQEAKINAFRDRYVHVRFPVAGVTFKNEDGTDRQKILLEISFNSAADTDFWLMEEQPELGDESGIRVMTDYGCVGYIRRSEKSEARRFTGREICTKYLSAEQFINDEGKAIYRADATFVIDRESPRQQWYFE